MTLFSRVTLPLPPHSGGFFVGGRPAVARDLRTSPWGLLGFRPGFARPLARVLRLFCTVFARANGEARGLRGLVADFLRVLRMLRLMQHEGRGYAYWAVNTEPDMADENLEHLLVRKDEIHRVSPWASVRLRYIRDDLAPLIDKGVPIKHLLALLAPLDITNRRETLRQFVLDEFPEEYARYYAKRATAARIRSQAGETTPPPTPPKATHNPPKSEPEPAPSRTGTKRLTVDSMLGKVGDFSRGKHFETNDGE